MHVGCHRGAQVGLGFFEKRVIETSVYSACESECTISVQTAASAVDLRLGSILARGTAYFDSHSVHL